MNEELMEIVDETVAINDCVKVLFLGDPYQLNPINEEHSRALDYDGVELKTIMRQAEGNPIIQLAHEIRIAQETESSIIHWHDYVDNKRIHIYGSINQFIESYLHDFIHGVDAHIVAWRNSKVISTNDYIREQLYGVDAKIPFLVGEQVMLYTPIIREVNGKKRILMDNSEIATVLKVETTQERVANSIVDSYRLTLKSDYREKSVYAYYPVDKPEFDAALQTIVNNAKAASDSRKRAFIFSTYYYPLKNYFTELRPAHALTSHKSQGSTYQKVYVHVQDIGLNRNLIERLRSLYVACTRGSEELHLYGVGRPRSK
jgi:exodeoxyribonuclease-5